MHLGDWIIALIWRSIKHIVIIFVVHVHAIIVIIIFQSIHTEQPDTLICLLTIESYGDGKDVNFLCFVFCIYFF